MLFSRIALKHIFAMSKWAATVWFAYISKRQSNFANSWVFIFTKLRICEVSWKKNSQKISKFTVYYVTITVSLMQGKALFHLDESH